MRVSSDSDRQNTDLQRDALLAAGVDERHLFEDRISSATKKRPGLDEALEYLKNGDTLLVWKLDRLGRSFSHLIEIVNDLKQRGIGFKSLTEQMDTTTVHGELLFNFFDSLAQYERVLISERVRAGLNAAAKRGRRRGRPRAIGSEDMEVIKEMSSQGKSFAAISRIIKHPQSTINDALNREAIS